MPLINIDVKSLELYTAAYLSQDPIMMKELIDGIDMHSRNELDFGLPSRLIAKILGFRILYGGSAYSFANDPDFTSVSKSDKYWQSVIDKYYAKYSGLKLWHNNLLLEVMKTGKLVMPTGRCFSFQMYEKHGGEWKWPVTNIKNYPVQGTGSDLVAIYRVSLNNRLKKTYKEYKLLATVHDSVLIDCKESDVDYIVSVAHEAAAAVPKNFEKLFGKEYNLPFLVECEVGSNYKDMESYK